VAKPPSSTLVRTVLISRIAPDHITDLVVDADTPVTHLPAAGGRRR
jgi:hypothetical protein